MTGRFTPRLAGWPIDPIVRRLRTLSKISEMEEALVRALSDRRERHAPGEELIVEGQGARRPRFVVAGWAARQRVLPDGRRQIFSLILPGDSLGLAQRSAPPAPWSVVALTALETVDAEPALDAANDGRAPGLAQAFAASMHEEGRLLLDHMVRLGQQTAYERVAHFLLELQRRLQIAGLGDSQRFPLPLTQEMLADTLGLSIVHVNRTLQQLRRERLIELRSGVAILLQPQTLRDVAAYEAAPPRRPAAAPPLRRQMESSPA
ncbi:Crp/Fnr family transcriptional regulator [Phenylobacterium sp.]|uniref:Crp/Fnr family transcriptional regulator n=1 Tax=Phenylobacterium sp. TaxID=1871053 RepID=UPI002810B8CF|nr:Crp/Fnr family transcriptional regulator [Phenylobacterium sp.]